MNINASKPDVAATPFTAASIRDAVELFFASCQATRTNSVALFNSSFYSSMDVRR
ncbi:hypothetical protein ACH6EH_18655 [Paenibacillus sp. JSM ZJ436]|uniref:hypothetical protein n=1 Tax=Paenibacillus sp. JSM ZJ436 TaxID=3376190 RepID=UPI0037A98FCA